MTNVQQTNGVKMICQILSSFLNILIMDLLYAKPFTTFRMYFKHT